MRLSRSARQDMLDDIHNGVYSLTIKHRPTGTGPWLPGLLYSLDNSVPFATQGPERDPDERMTPRPKPGSKPPLNIDWPSSAREIRDGAVEWDQIIRNSHYKQRPTLAFRSITMSSETLDDDDLQLLRVTVGKWTRAAEILLGYIDPVLDMPIPYDRNCFDCGEPKIMGVVLSRSAWCYGCGSEYTNARIRSLLRTTV